jgi:hypothetical protein
MTNQVNYCFNVVASRRPPKWHREPHAVAGTAEQFAQAMLEDALAADPSLAGEWVTVNVWERDRAGVFVAAHIAARASHDPYALAREAAREELRRRLPPDLPSTLTLPATQAALVLRTDFTDDAAWDAVCAASVAESPEGFSAALDFVSDPAFGGLTGEHVAGLASESDRTFLFLVDHVTVTDPEMPLVAVDLYDEPGRWFRVTPGRLWGIENNLALGNMTFRVFAEHADPDGVFRGFPGERDD